MKVLTAVQMREVDRLTTERYGIPGLELMESAAGRTIEAAENKFGPLQGKHALIMCGRGNNGGDGAAIARQLHTRGVRVRVLLLGGISDSSGDARTNFEIARSIATSGEPGFDFVEIHGPESVDQLYTQAHAHRYDLLFDAIFGTGLTRPAAGVHEQAIRIVNELGAGAPVIAVDIPSGVASDSAELIGPSVRADLTVTFTSPKVANVLPPACYRGGELIVAQIGSPVSLVDQVGSRLNRVERDTISNWLASSRRRADANKGDAGKVLIVAGSRGKTGAACLAGAAAMRAGAGLVTIATPASSQPVIASQALFECMTEGLAETEDGSASREAATRVSELARERDVTAAGPGLGSSQQSTRELVRSIVDERQKPLVLDADALNALSPWPDELAGSADLPVILTPHPGEMARLMGKSIPDVLRDRVGAASAFATRHHVILVLKGSRTLIAAPDAQVYVNPTGNPGMATGGTGDVLTGLIAGLLAQKPGDPLGAVIAAVYLHGFAGDIAASRLGVRAMIASDITANLGEAFIAVGGPEERLSK
jgi:hydroxyethylthiazole kinase-like uncharacterized protein yjeF